MSAHGSGINCLTPKDIFLSSLSNVNHGVHNNTGTDIVIVPMYLNHHLHEEVTKNRDIVYVLHLLLPQAKNGGVIN